MLAQVIAGGTDEVADIFDEEEVQFGKVPTGKRRRTISASRWQVVPVVICRTGTCDRARRCASLSVARSPTSAAVRNREPSACRVFSKNIVLPAPGLDTRLITNTPASRNA